MNKRIYLDNSATTRLDDDVKTAIVDALNIFGNASSMHEEGRQANKLIQNARNNVANLINANTKKIIFTSGGTESNNTVLNLALESIKLNDSKNEIIVSQIEHPSILKSAKRIEEMGFKIHYLPVNNDGIVEIETLKSVINSRTALVSVMTANNEIGSLQNIKEITKVAHKFGALVHTDAVQAIGKIQFDVKELDVDYASISAHKIGGPKGIGALFVKNSAFYKPFIVGGHQENNKRAGTENLIGIVGFGKAAKKAIDTPIIYQNKIKPIKDKLCNLISSNIPNIVINGNDNKCLPNILNVSFAGAEGESILLRLDYHGIAVSTGSACASGDAKPSHVLMAIKADPELAHGSIRFSFGLDNVPEDADIVMKYLPTIIKELRGMSTISIGVKNG